ncbi:hypothetical protein GCM10009422_12910 [Brevundimonas kwangchunensis]|uniref:Tat pathway signal sequence domain protein n=1 Tax=Brevundimonas kwangchunensis TaxID=322163 RepID=A0ABN1GTA6_9CAUL
MRRVLKVSLASLMAVATLSVGMVPSMAEAQQSQRPGGQQGQEEPQPTTRAPRIAPLQRRAAAGPCPYVKILYDAARYVEMPSDRVSASNVGYTGEIEGLSSDCAYQSDQPISVDARILFSFGRGPQAEGQGRTYRYWIAVTERNRAVLDKVYFDVPVSFENGENRTAVVQENTIVIPRANATTSGSNFEILIGFDVTPEMAEFNRTGSRFRVNAGAAPTAGEPAPSTEQ